MRKPGSSGGPKTDDPASDKLEDVPFTTLRDAPFAPPTLAESFNLFATV